MKYLKFEHYLTLSLSVFLLSLMGAANFVMGAESVTWTNGVNVTITGNSIEKTGGGNQSSDAGAISQQQLSSGDGSIEFTVPSNKEMVVGLGKDTSSATTGSNIDYAFSFNGASAWEILENGAYRSDGSFSANSVFKIEIVGNQVKYYVITSDPNSGQSPVYTSSVTPTYPLVLDAALLESAAKVTNAQIQTSGTPPSGPCAPSVKTDLGLYPEPTLPTLPAAGGKFCDPTFGTEIMRVTDSNDGNTYGTEYSYYPTFNSDNTQLYVYANDSTDTSFVIDFDPQAFTIQGNKRVLPQSVYASGIIWSNSQPNKLYGVEASGGGGAILYEINTDTMSKTIVKNFNNSPNFSSGDYLAQMSVSEDEDVFAFTRKDAAYSDVGFLAFKRSSNQILYDENVPFNAGGFDEVQIDKSGRYLVIKQALVDNLGNEGYVKDLQTGSLEGLKDANPDYSPGHSDNGTNLVIGHENNQTRLLSRNLSSPHSFTTVFDFDDDVDAISQDYHISLRANDESWSTIATTNGDSYGCTTRNGALRNEIFLVKNDGSKDVQRLAHHRSLYAWCEGGTNATNYSAAVRANISRDGKFIAFTSSWGNQGANARTDLFLLKVPQSTNPPSTNEVVWQDVQNTSSSGNDVEHDGSSNYNATARSQQQIGSGLGSFEFEFDGHLVSAGLANDTNSIDFEVRFNTATTFEIWESGVYRGDGAAQVGNTFKIEITSTGDVIYEKNDQPISINRSGNPSLSYPYFLLFKAQDDTSQNESISDAIFEN